MTRVSVVGTGYVGLVSGACFAELGHQVVCLDIDRAKVDRINAGDPPIHENGLPELLARTIGRTLRASTDLCAAVDESDVTFIAVGTPAHGGRIDLRFVEAAAHQVGEALARKKDYHTVVVKSTVVPGTTDGAVRVAVEKGSGRRAGDGFGLGMNPEFLTEGRAIEDFMKPDRLVFGGVDARTHGALASLYESFETVPRIVTNNATAEMIKYASNATLAAMISLANEFGRVCSALENVDIVDVMHGVHQSLYFTTRNPGTQPSVAHISSFLEAGCGFGGSCLPKDVTALIAHAGELGVQTDMLRAVLKVNADQPDQVLQLIQRHFSDLNGVEVTVLGLAFKPDTDDIRESPAFPIIRSLRKRGAIVTAYDPVVRQADHADLKDMALAGTFEASLARASVVVLVTRWPEFQELPVALARLGRSPLVVDGRRVLNPGDYAAYEGIGR